MNLYTKYAKDFSTSRQQPWEGWKKALPIIQKINKPLKVLDLGSGNGRFFQFLITNDELLINTYVGIDNSDELLEIAETSFKESAIDHKFINADLNKSDWAENLGKFDLIVGFGLMHHLESNLARKNLIQNASKLLSQNGILIISYWMFKENEEFMKKHIVKDLGNNDYILSFAGSAERFCHYSSTSEIEELYLDSNLDPITTFRSDGFKNEMNLYNIRTLSSNNS